MTTQTITKITEEQAREMTTCPKCKKEKGLGLIVCWTCFKEGPNPFKYANQSLEDWLLLN